LNGLCANFARAALSTESLSLLKNFEMARDELDHRTKEKHETLLDQQTRSMKYNLIFENIPEVIPNTDIKEDTQQII
jgi:hypothetical protein